MKVNIEIDCTPLEARQFFGLPDVGPMQVAVMDKLQQQVAAVDGDEDHPLTVALGKDVHGRAVMVNLATMPHVLIAGATGAGKSSLINTFITSVLMRATPDDVRMMLVDPKRVELANFADIPHLLAPVIVNPKRAAEALGWVVREMEMRYEALAMVGVRDIYGYEEGLADGTLRIPPGQESKFEHMPFMLVVIDELADLMMGTASRREVEALIIMLAQKARAVGIHLIVATQRPSVDVITGLMKTNFPARISYKVTSVYDSKTILDHGGSETLLGNGDMLFLQPGAAGLIRVHGPFVGDEEVQKVVEHLKSQGAPVYDESIAAAAAGADEEEADATQDPLFEKALEEVRGAGRCSVSMIQRKLSIGYNRAARIVEAMERMGFVGPAEGGKPREVYAPRD